MIDIEKAKDEFMKFVEDYDNSEENITRKIYHTLRVMDLSKEIAKSLNLTEEQADLAALIGLLHDIGRFEQWKTYQTYVDLKSTDHGHLGVEMLKENNFIRNFVKDNKYDDIIFTAIENHNKYAIDENVKGENLMYSKIIRDADKLDILYESTEMFWNTEKEKNEIENADPICEEYFLQFKDCKQILMKLGKPNKINSIFLKLALIFDLNSYYSIKYVKEKNFIDEIVDRFDYKKDETKKQIEEARKIVKDYVEKRLVVNES